MPAPGSCTTRRGWTFAAHHGQRRPQPAVRRAGHHDRAASLVPRASSQFVGQPGRRQMVGGLVDAPGDSSGGFATSRATDQPAPLADRQLADRPILDRAELISPVSEAVRPRPARCPATTRRRLHRQVRPVEHSVLGQPTDSVDCGSAPDLTGRLQVPGQHSQQGRLSGPVRAGDQD